MSPIMTDKYYIFGRSLDKSKIAAIPISEEALHEQEMVDACILQLMKDLNIRDSNLVNFVLASPFMPIDGLNILGILTCSVTSPIILKTRVYLDLPVSISGD